MLEYHLPRKGSLPAQIAAGADGNIWFTENFSGRVARMTPKGVITEFTLPVSGKYEAIVSGPDGNLWIAVNRPGPAPNSTAGAIALLVVGSPFSQRTVLADQFTQKIQALSAQASALSHAIASLSSALGLAAGG